MRKNSNSFVIEFLAQERRKSKKMLLSDMSWLFVAIALYGTYLNSNMDKAGFYFWLVSNLGFFFINLESRTYSQAFLFAVYTALSVRGLAKWD